MPPPPPPDALIVTIPCPPTGEIVTFVPAIICVTATLLRPVNVDVSWLEEIYPRVANPAILL